MDESLTFAIITTCAQSISICACFLLFYLYFYLPRKSVGFQMILVLCISDFIFHTMMLIFTWTSIPLVADISETVCHVTLRFSIFWASSIAFLIYQSLNMQNAYESEVYSKKTFIVTFLVSSVLSVICSVFRDIFSIIFTIVVPLSLSLLFTTVCYLKCITLLESRSTLLKKSMAKTIKNLYLYAFVHLISAGPTVVYYVLDTINTSTADPFRIYVSLPLGFAGIINSTVYFFQRRTAFTSSEGINLSFVHENDKTESLQDKITRLEDNKPL